MGRVAREIISHVCAAEPNETHYGLTYERHFDQDVGAKVGDDWLFKSVQNLKRLDISDIYESIPYDLDDRFLRREANTLRLADKLREIGAAQYWNLTPFIGDSFVPILDLPTVAILYDAIPFLYQKHYLPDNKWAQYYIEQVAFAKECDALISISNTTRQDFAMHFGVDPSKITTIYPLLGPRFREAAAEETPQSHPNTGPQENRHAICVSSHHHTKNLPQLCMAWDKALAGCDRNVTLKIVLASETFRQSLIDDVGRRNGIELLIDVSEQELVSLYRNARFCVQPSNYEGFGYPVVESVALGVPTIANNTRIFKEVGKGLPHYVDSNNVEEFGMSLRRAIEDDDWVDKLRLRTDAGRRQLLRDLEITSDHIQQVKNQAASRFHSRSETTATAIASSYYPDKCGIVDYVDNIASRLSAECPTFVIVRSGMEPLISLGKHYVVCTEKAAELLIKRWPDTRIFYQLGGSSWQYFMWRMMQRLNGTSVFHDLTMGEGVFLLSDAHDKRAVFDRLFEAEPASRTKSLAVELAGKNDQEAWTSAIRSALGGRLNAFALKTSKRALVHDEQFRRMLVEDADDAAIAEKIEAVPLAKRDIRFKMRNLNRTALREATFDASGAFVIGMFGNIVPNKLVREGLAAIASLKDRYALHVLIVGNPVDDGYYQEIKQLVDDHGMSEQVTLKDWVSDDEFDRLLYSCDVVLNLRYPPNIGMTGPGVQAISAGVPVIVSQEAMWSAFGPETGEEVICSNGDTELQIADALDRILPRIEALRKSAYERYRSSLTIDKLVPHYRSQKDA